MAVAELTPLILTRNAITDLSTVNQVVLDSATGGYIDYFSTSQNNQQGRLILIIATDSDQAGGSDFIVESSTNQPFTGSGMADLDVTLSADSAEFGGTLDQRVSILGPIETARHVDTDGYINFKLDTSDTHGNNYVTAIIIP